MAFSFCFSLSFFFLFLGHSTLLHFLTLDNPGVLIPLSKIVVPRPSRGKAVAWLSIVVSGFFLAISFLVAPDSVADLFAGARILVPFVLLPAASYGYYIFTRLTISVDTTQRVVMFVPRAATKAELAAPVVAAVGLNMLSLLIRSM